ncbi:MAG: chromosome segregation protein SMC, partial [Verrucomicrobia bacterium]|nr:chromosome segregation protein SMC [Verrucomicrobiota bacterium]
DDNILAVINKNGQTIIGPVDAAGRSSIRDKLFTAGELLRLSQLTPDVAEVQATPESQLDLFGRKTH